MAFEFKLPDIGEGVVEGEVVKWKVAEGDTVKLDQPMVEIMTDKATVEIPAPRAGKVLKLMVAEGKICAVGGVLIVIDDGKGGSATVPPPVAAAPAPAAAKANGNGHAGNGAGGHPPVHMSTAMAGNLPEVLSSSSASSGGRVTATPATRKLARELGVDLGGVAATGPHGRITSDDVRRAKQGGGAGGGRRGETMPMPMTAPQGSPPAARPGFAPQAIAQGGAEERVPMRGMRKVIAANMTRSKQTATHFTYVEEIDMTDLVRVRGRAKERAAERGVKLTYLPFIVKATVAALKKWPSLNASLDETTNEIVYKKYYHIGIATQGPQGLSVGVVRDADKRSLFEIAGEIERISAAIRDGKATREDLTGSTFTISSLGQLGGVLATPIINFPESGIMGVHKIAEKPAVRDGQICVRQLMNLSISVDHRIADGYDGAMVLQEVKQLLEEPALLFMESM